MKMKSVNAGLYTAPHHLRYLKNHLLLSNFPAHCDALLHVYDVAYVYAVVDRPPFLLFGRLFVKVVHWQTYLH